jgi:hypothetical protein
MDEPLSNSLLFVIGGMDGRSLLALGVSRWSGGEDEDEEKYVEQGM